jgi:hypothetical protein
MRRSAETGEPRGVPFLQDLGLRKREDWKKQPCRT